MLDLVQQIELEDWQREVRADPRIYEASREYPLSRLAVMYGKPYHVFLDFVLRCRGYIL